MNSKSAKTTQLRQRRIGSWFVRGILGIALVVSTSAVTTGCRDTASVCLRYVQKYAYCFRRTHQRAERKQRRLPKAQRQRMAPMLQALADKIHDPGWQKRAVKRCLRTPPSQSRYACIQRTSCQALSTCDPKRPKL